MIDHTFVIDRRCGDAASFSLSQSQQIDVSASDSNSEPQLLACLVKATVVLSELRSDTVMYTATIDASARKT